MKHGIHRPNSCCVSCFVSLQSQAPDRSQIHYRPPMRLKSWLTRHISWQQRKIRNASQGVKRW